MSFEPYCSLVFGIYHDGLLALVFVQFFECIVLLFAVKAKTLYTALYVALLGLYKSRSILPHSHTNSHFNYLDKSNTVFFRLSYFQSKI